MHSISVYCSFWAGLPSPLAARDQTDNGFLMGKDGMGRFRRIPVPSRNVPQHNASAIDGGVGAHHKLLVYRFLCRQILPIPVPLEPHESGYRSDSGCLIIGRDVSRSSAAHLLRRSAGGHGNLQWLACALQLIPLICTRSVQLSNHDGRKLTQVSGLMVEEKSMVAGETAHGAAGRSCCRSTSRLLEGAQSAQSRSREGRDHPAAVAGVKPATAGEPPELRHRTWRRHPRCSDPSHPTLLPTDEPAAVSGVYSP